ncbi:hypothetical protein [Caulobacter sp. LARHSG274]
MTLYTAQCGYAGYYAHVGQVEAEGVEAACEAAVAQANDSAGWRALDHVGPTFVDAIAVGEGDPWLDGASALPVPLLFTEGGETALVHIVMEGGAIHEVVFAGAPCRVLITDYAVEGPDPGPRETDAHERPVLAFRLGPRPPRSRS